MTQAINPSFEVEEVNTVSNVGVLVIARKLDELDFKLNDRSLLGGVPISGGDIPRNLNESGAQILSTWGFFLKSEKDQNKFKKGDTEGFVNIGLSIEGIKFALIFIENKGEEIIKISLRSKGDFSVNEFSRNHFEGGGHHNAAGGRSYLSLSDTVDKFISILPSYKNALNQ